MSFTTTHAHDSNGKALAYGLANQPAKPARKRAARADARRKIMILSNRARALAGLGITDAEAQSWATQCSQVPAPVGCFFGDGPQITQAINQAKIGTQYNATLDTLYQQYVDNYNLNKQAGASWLGPLKTQAEYNAGAETAYYSAPQPTQWQDYYTAWNSAPAPTQLPAANIPPPPPITKEAPIAATTYTNWQVDPYQYKTVYDAAGNAYASYEELSAAAKQAAAINPATINWLEAATAALPVSTTAPAQVVPAGYVDPYLSAPVPQGIKPATPPPAVVINLPPTLPTTTPGVSTPNVLGSNQPLTQQLQVPTSSVLPAAVNNAAPEWLKELPIWQTGLLVAGVGYFVYARKQGRRR